MDRRKNRMKASWLELRTGTDHSANAIIGKTFLKLQLCSSPSGAGRQALGALLRSSPVVSLLLGERSHSPAVPGVPPETLLHELLQGEFISRTAALHKLLQLPHSPMGSQVLPGPCSSVGSSLHGFAGPCQVPAPAQVSHGVPAPAQAPPAPARAPPGAAGASLLSGPSMGCRGPAASPGAAQGISGQSAPAPGAAPAPPPALPWGVQSCSSHVFSPCSSLLTVTPTPSPIFLNLLPQRCYRHFQLAQPWPAAGASWSWLELTLWDTEEQLLPAASHRRCSSSSPYQNLAMQTKYKHGRVFITIINSSFCYCHYYCY
uniref:nascent polypeptide-associated complex subunit alpha, muscle-specific form-like isoform X1 n=1 Tax=Agelaius phoeniceus TaxID=39638 RepID=UPI0023EBEE47|nr:nascent polypeptide-associated complex subunit alpha, muscle-specific form-like isoform X1 [Agelaius phoeniceus]